PTSYAFQYGYAEIRARAALGSGLWSAFWMLPASTKDDHLEIDVMESQGWNTRQYTGGYHQWASGSGPWGSWDLPFDVTEDFHTYAIEWQPDRLSFLVDGVEMARLTDRLQIPQQAMYLIVSLEITNWAWIGGVTLNGSAMAVDHVRVWQRNAATLPAPPAPSNALVEVRLEDSGFESHGLPDARFTMNPDRSAWSFRGSGGVRSNGGDWGVVKAPEGRQSAFLQGGSAGSVGQITQSVDTPAGRYKLTLQAAQRAGFGAQPIRVLVDGQVVATITPAWTAFSAYETPEFDLTEGRHTITLAASTDQAGQVSFIDDVRLIKVFSPLEGGWIARDVGAPTLAGRTTVVDGVTLVSGSGSGIDGARDEFQFVSKEVSGNATLAARLSSQTRTDEQAKAGLTFRASDAPDSAFVAIMKTPAHGLVLQWRDAAGNVDSVRGPVLWSPVTFRLVRRGNTFTAFYSTDGKTYAQLGAAVTVAMPTSALAGLAVTSQDRVARTASAFDFVSLTNP
ncbi:MAG: family 16 glycosylhydrolase, partial [Isosphaeraceae bacterium]